MTRFGYSSSGIATMKSLHATAQAFADATGEPASSVLQMLNFSSGTGAKLAANQLSWDAYTSQLEGGVVGIIDQRQSFGMDANDVIDWWSNIGQPRTSALSVAERAYETLSPVGDVAAEGVGNALDAIPLWVKVGGGGLLVVLLMGQFTPLVKMMSSVFKAGPKRRYAGRSR